MNTTLDAHPDSAKGRIISPSDPRWGRLRDQIQRDALKTGEFTLSSGRKSTFIFQLRQTTLHPEGAFLLSDMVVDYMAAHGLRFIGGLIMGAVPIAASVTAVSHSRGKDVRAFFVRKEAKPHGALEIIDGFLGPGKEVLLIDDVATTGGSILKALAILKQQGFEGGVEKALVIIDREEGAEENLAKEGIELVSIFKKSDFAIR